MGDNFYCYSSRMAHFIRAFDVKYEKVGFNKNTQTKYYIFNKSKKLDEIIQLYNNVKFLI